MQIIQNEKDLIQHHAKFSSFNISISALKKAIDSVDPVVLINRAIKLIDNKRLVITDVNDVKYYFDLKDYESFHIFGAGKATARMAKSLMESLTIEISSGAITIPYNEKVLPDKLIVIEAGHPIPDENSIRGTKQIIDLLKKIENKSLVFVLISGGSSSLLCCPLDGLKLQSKQEITKLLLQSGASIQEINTVRKHLSKIKGGRLPKYVNGKAKIITLILSDVVGDDLSTIGSGPTVGDNSTFANCKEILERYELWNPNNHENAIDILNVRKVIEDGNKGIIEETPSLNDNLYKNVSNILIGNNEIACKSAMNELMNFGIKTKYLGSDINSEAKVFGKKLAELLKFQRTRSFNNKKGDDSFAYVMGGETVVNLKSKNFNNKVDGKGGRNQEAIVSSINYLQDIRNLEDFIIICCGTDGIDGNSESAGGLVSPSTLEYIKRTKINVNSFLNSHDSETLLKRVYSHIVTGRTGTNVNDIAIICKQQRRM
jgi:glycerate 2-kinase